MNTCIIKVFRWVFLAYLCKNDYCQSLHKYQDNIIQHVTILLVVQIISFYFLSISLSVELIFHKCWSPTVISQSLIIWTNKKWMPRFFSFMIDWIHWFHQVVTWWRKREREMHDEWKKIFVIIVLRFLSKVTCHRIIRWIDYL